MLSMLKVKNCPSCLNNFVTTPAKSSRCSLYIPSCKKHSDITTSKMCQLSSQQLHVNFISWLNGTYYCIEPAGGISSRKCDTRKACKSQIPKGRVEFMLINCDTGRPESIFLAPYDHLFHNQRKKHL